MAKNEYYTYKETPINGDVMMSVQVFDIIAKQVVSKDNDVVLDTSRGFTMSGTNKKVSCQIENNEVSITIHIKVKYGVRVSAKCKELQKDITTAIRDMTNVDVKTVTVVVQSIEF